MRPLRLFSLGSVLFVAACSPRAIRREAVSRPPADVLAPGVVHQAIPEGDALSPNSEAHVLDIDLRSSAAAVRIVSSRTELAKGRLYGESRTVLEWCRLEGALGGVNGGFFGTTDGSKKEVIGLLASGGEILASGRIVRSPSDPTRQIVRCVFSLSPEGAPHIGWAVGQRGRGAILTEYATPANPTSQIFWKAESAVACGPRLIRWGKIQVTDRDERLVSPPALRRTFVAYDLENGKPRHLVLGIGMQMTFQDAAALLQRYFREAHSAACAEAMCLDGGSSTQIAYRIPTGYESQLSSVTVPTAILVVPRDR